MSIISGKEIKTPEEIKEILESDEKVLYGVQQAGLGGKITGLESIFITTKRVIKMKPKTLGLRADIEDYMYKDMANVKLDKGIFRSSIFIVMRFRSDSVNIENIPKDDAYKIFKAIDDGIAGRLNASAMI
jgi:hypothetical protein